MQTTPVTSFQYEVKNGSIVITKFIGDETEVVIPKEIDGLPVSEIYYWVFQGCEKLKSVAIPASVTRIGDHAFSGCPGLNIHAPAGSAAEKYANENGIPFEPQD